jgi:hypothetical protein
MRKTVLLCFVLLISWPAFATHKGRARQVPKPHGIIIPRYSRPTLNPGPIVRGRGIRR